VATSDPRPKPDPGVIDRFMTEGWAPESAPQLRPLRGASYWANHRDALSRAFPGKTLIIPTGGLKARANDTDYRFRPGSDFFWLTGFREPDAVLVMTPKAGGGHDARLFMSPRSDQSTPRFFRDSRYGEMWVGPRPGLEEVSATHGITTVPIADLEKALQGRSARSAAVLRGVDARIDALVPAHRADARLGESLGDLRLVKDDFEVDMLRRAMRATKHGFEDVVRNLPGAVRRGERYVEGVFNLRARVEGNDVGYGSIAAAGDHATTLHWTENDGRVVPGDLLLLDAGVEDDELYTADVTRTIPVSGRFSPAQREIYQLVLDAQRAGIRAAKPGATFGDVHTAAVTVLSAGLRRLGIPSRAVGPDVTDKMVTFRYMPHGTSHMLGLDVHDCALARQENYRGVLKPGYVLTVEPGLYFKRNDTTVPRRYRGIGVRIEDDVLITETGNRVLSRGLPKDPDAIERWMARLRPAAAPKAPQGRSLA
jgi:Xaa-Pro aminopeptidase